VTELYSLDQQTQQYTAESQPSPLKQYFYYNEQTQQYSQYVPQAPVWTDYYEAPSTDLYYYEPSVQSHVLVEDPSPYGQYVYYNEPSGEYLTYVPEDVDWEEYYEAPQTHLYYYDVPTQSF
jgi:hypothetical protein